MKASKEYYLTLRGLFLRMNYITEVDQLDVYFKLTFLTNKEGKLIKIL